MAYGRYGRRRTSYEAPKPRKTQSDDYAKWHEGKGPVPSDVWQKSERVKDLKWNDDGPVVILLRYPDGRYFLQMAGHVGWIFKPAIYGKKRISAKRIGKTRIPLRALKSKSILRLL
jgi:hypothetical protein